MPRRRSSGGLSAPHHPASSSKSNLPKPVNSAPPPAPVQATNKSARGGLGAAVADGLAFGTGSAIAHRAVDAVMGPRVIQQETVPSSAPTAAPAPTMNSLSGSDACNYQSKALQDCLNNYGTDISKCQFYMDMLSECRRNSSAAMSA